jgi:uncharacterized protein
MFRTIISRAVSAPLLLVCVGSIVHAADDGRFDNSLRGGDYRGASQIAMASGAVKSDGSSQNLIWLLQAGATLVYAGDAKTAIPVLDGAEKLMNGSGGTFSGQYQYATYDTIMADAYTALSFFLMGNLDNARVEFNRVRDRQTHAEESFAKEKEQLDQKTMAMEAQSKSVDYAGALKQVINTPQYQSEQRELAKFANYKPFINPFPSYLTGVFLISSAPTRSDVDKARTEFTHVRDMVGKNPTVLADLALTESAKFELKPRTWVIFEDGQAPTFIEDRITFPVPIIGNTSYVSTVTVAFPHIVFHESAYPQLLVTGGGQQAPTYPVGDFNSVVATEFQRRLPGIVTRGVVEAAVKVGVQYAANQAKGVAGALLKLGTAVVSNVSTADTRSWTSLPKGFQAARIDTPPNGAVHISTVTGQELGVVTVPAGQSNIVYAKAMVPGGKLALQVFPLAR